MSYTPPFIPRADADFALWATGYCTALNSDPARFMLTPAQTHDLMRRCNEFNAALGTASSPETRTRGTISAKDDARSILQHSIQQYAAFIRCNDGITDGDKIDIGVRPRNIAHNARTCPTTQPLLNYIGSLPGMDELRYHDSNTPNSKAKPRGAERLELWVAYAAVGGVGEPQPKVSQARLVGSFKKSKMLVEQDPQRDSRMEGDGKPTYWARWAGYDGQVGPWSLALRLSSVRKREKAAAEGAKTQQNARDDQSLRAPRLAV